MKQELKTNPNPDTLTNLELTNFGTYLIASGYSNETTRGILRNIQKFTLWIQQQNIETKTLSYNDITAYLQLNRQRQLKQKSLENILIHIKHYLNYLVKAETIPYNPVLGLNLKNVKTKTVYNILNTEELETIYKSYPTELPHNPKAPPQTINKLARKRNKILLGLIIYQGIAAHDIKNIQLKHLDLREGKIIILGTRRSNERTLKLEPHQIFDLYDYINDTRKAMLTLTGKQSEQLFTSAGSGYQVQNLLFYLFSELRKRHPEIKDLDQIRASIITNWLKLYNKRKVQYMAGHRYVSSTEAYEASNVDALQEDLEKYYPTL